MLDPSYGKLIDTFADLIEGDYSGEVRALVLDPLDTAMASTGSVKLLPLDNFISWKGLATEAYVDTAIGSIQAADDTAYGVSWNGVTTVPPSKNAVYDKIELLAADISTNAAAIVTVANNLATLDGQIDQTNIAYRNTTNTFSQDQTFSGNILFSTNDVSTIGVTGTRPNKIWVGTGGIDLSGSINFATSGSTIGHSTSVLWRFLNTANISLMNSTTERMRFGGSGIELNSAHYLGWNSTGSPTGSPDVIILRGGAGILEQRNGANAQTYNLYNTYTDASNYERGVFSWSVTTNVLTIGAMALGTGTRRSVTWEGETHLFRAGGNDRFAITNGTVTATANVEPNASATRDLGSTLLRWRNGYFNQLTVGVVDNVTALTISGSSLTAANAQSLVSLSQTWNTTGSPTGFLANFTNTASGASTNLFDWQLGGVSQFKLHKSTGLSLFQGGQTLTIGSAAINSDNGSFTYGTNNCKLIFSSNLLLQRNGVSANSYQLFRTYTDASNQAYLEQTWSGNNAFIRTVGAGTGTQGDLLFNVTTTRVDTAGRFCIGTSSGTSLSSPFTITADGGGNGFTVIGTGATLLVQQGGVLSSVVASSSTVPFVIGTSAGATVAGSEVRLIVAGSTHHSFQANTTSTAGVSLSGAVFSGGTGTTTFPYYLHSVTGATAVTTWSTSGTFFGVNAASSFAGRFFDYRINGSANLVGALDNAGNLYVANSIQFNNAGSVNVTGISVHSTGLLIAAESAWPAKFLSSGVRFLSTASIQFSDGTAFGGTSDVFVYRGGAGIWEQRNGANSQEFRVYRTYTDASNYSYFHVDETGGYWYCRPVALGTGTITGAVYGNPNYESYLDGSTVTIRGTSATVAATFTSTAITLQQNITISDAKNIALNATTGTKIGTATTQKLGFWNATPVAQWSSAADDITGDIYPIGPPAMTIGSKFTGNIGSTAYTICEIVAALKSCGIMAA